MYNTTKMYKGLNTCSAQSDCPSCHILKVSLSVLAISLSFYSLAIC